MTSSLKGLLAATALLAAVAVHAQSTESPADASPGTGALVFSSDGLSALRSSMLYWSAPTDIPDLAGVSVAADVNPASYVDDLSSGSGTLGLNFSSVGITGNAVTSLAAPDAFVRWQRRIVDLETGEMAVHQVILTGLEFDLTHSTVNANLFAFDAAGVATSLGRKTIFSATEPGLVGGTQGNIVVSTDPSSSLPLYTASGSLAGNLAITAEASGLILNNLGFESGEAQFMVNDWLGTNWGTVSFNYATAVPELSTNAMLGIGLIGMGGLVRRRRAV
jgi:hypothetical protein